MVNTKTPAMVLQEFVVRNHHPPIEYILTMSKDGTHDNEFHFSLTLCNLTSCGFGRSKQVAKHNAASNLLKLLCEEGLYDIPSASFVEFNAGAHRNNLDLSSPPVNYVGDLKTLCLENKLPYPIFNNTSDVGPPHCRQFTYECLVSSIKTQKTANTKKQAKQLVAQEMLNKILKIVPELQLSSAPSNSITESVVSLFPAQDKMFPDVIKDRKTNFADFIYCFSKVMYELDLKFDDFLEYFIEQTWENLDKIIKKLNLEHKTVSFDLPEGVLIIFNIGLDTPFAVGDYGRNEEEAREKLLKKIYEQIEIFMKTKMKESLIVDCVA